LSQLIAKQTDMEVVDTAATGHDAVRRAAELQPDIVLMDIHMPDMDGIQATWLVSSKVPRGGVIMVTSEERIDFLQKAMTAGAQGYVLKPLETARRCSCRSAKRTRECMADSSIWNRQT
jgi:YesN/AraC family two-component response regulator